tara:strand:+ start:688 stop:846 length:159 start_codon:yes stop_codon:yes gene_type:complete
MEKVHINKDDIASWVEHEVHKYTNKWYGKLSKEEFLDGIGNTIYSKVNELNK